MSFELFQVVDIAFRCIICQKEVGDIFKQGRKFFSFLNPEQEFVVLELRKTLLLSLDDLLVIVHDFFKPDMTRSSLYRLLKRHNMHRLSELIPQEDNLNP